MRAAGIRNPRAVVVRNLAKSERRNFASFAPSVKDSRAVSSSVLLSDSDSVSELSDSAKRGKSRTHQGLFLGFRGCSSRRPLLLLNPKMKRLRKTLTEPLT
jgi:hypothetical protein